MKRGGLKRIGCFEPRGTSKNNVNGPLGFSDSVRDPGEAQRKGPNLKGKSSKAVVNENKGTAP